MTDNTVNSLSNENEVTLYVNFNKVLQSNKNMNYWHFIFNIRF